jgi:glycosyltransferase involved in cell wall biosynthesis
MKIGIFTESYVPQLDGVATSVYAQSKALEKLGHEVYIIAPRFPNQKEKKNVIRLFSIKVYERPLVRVGLQIPQRSLIKILKIDFDIIHGHSGGPVTFLGWQIAQMKKIPYVATYHTMWNRYAHYFLKGAIRPRMLEMSSVLFGNVCDCLIAPTGKVKDELREYGVKKPIHVIPSGLQTETFLNVKKGYLRKKLHLHAHDRILLSVCRLGKEKSVDFLVKSFKEIYDTDPSVYFVMVGEGSERNRLEEMAKSLGILDRVRFTGGIPNKRIPQVYADADLFLFASKTETQGLVILEAMSSGLPVVAVEDKAFKDIVKNDYNGFLVKKNSKLFAQHVRTLLGDAAMRTRMSANARLTGERYSVSHPADQLEKVYEELVRQRVAEKNSWKDVMQSLNADVSHFFQDNRQVERVYINMRELDRIKDYIKNRLIR